MNKKIKVIDLLNKIANGEEEKKAIETMQTIIEFGGDNFLCKEHRKQLQIILNLIEKQQKEISLLKDQLEYVKSEYEETIEQQQKEIEELKEKNGVLQNELNKKIEALDKAMNNPDYISKNKIKAKIENLEKQDKESKLSHNYLVIPVLQELLKEE